MEVYAQYAALEEQILALEEQKKALRIQIEEILPEEGVKNEFVTASWKSNKKWKYSDTVNTLETKLKEDKTKIDEVKTKEEAEGIATFEETKSLVIRTK